MRILITAIGTATAQVYLKDLGTEHTLIGCDILNEELCAGTIWVDKYYKVPKASDYEYIQSIFDIVEKEKVDIVIPILDPEIEVLSLYRKSFPCEIVVSDYENICTLNDKLTAYKSFIQHKIDTPFIWDRLPPIGRKIILKPRQGFGSKNNVVFKLRSFDQYITLKTLYKDSIVQDYIDGTEYTVDAIVDKCNFSYICGIRERVETKSGLCSKAKIVNKPDLEKLSTKVLDTLCLYGHVNLQFIQDKNGKYWLIEVNPRAAGSAAITIKAGNDIPRMVIDLVKGKKIKPKKLKEGLIMLRYWEEVYNE